MTLLKGGKEVVVSTFSVLPFWKTQRVGLGSLYCKNAFVPPSQSLSSSFFFPLLLLALMCSLILFFPPLLATRSIGYFIVHMRNGRLPYLLDYEGKFHNATLINTLFFR